MSEITSQLSSVERRALAVLEEKFPELSERYCLERQGALCGITMKKCQLESCPKMKEQLGKHP